MTLVEARGLTIGFPGQDTPAVRGIDFTLGREKVGLVGESGSGKSLTARALLRLLPDTARLAAERLTFGGVDMLRADERALRSIRGRRAGLVLQDPRFSLNPVMTAGAQIAEAARAHGGIDRSGAARLTLDLLVQVGIREPEQVARRYPHQLSGGMGQRVMIAMMLAPDPELLIADEPTSALDATVQADVLRLIDAQVSKRGMGLLLISHDLPLVARFCDRVLVMRAGGIVEELSDLRAATHPYTRGLLACLPSLRHAKDRLPTLPRDAA